MLKNIIRQEPKPHCFCSDVALAWTSYIGEEPLLSTR